LLNKAIDLFNHKERISLWKDIDSFIENSFLDKENAPQFKAAIYDTNT
jgi:hypothetical protein